MAFRLEEISGAELSIRENSTPILTYCYGDSAEPPYFHPIYAPGGQQTTGAAEVKQRESKGLYFTCGTVHGKNEQNAHMSRKMQNVISTVEIVKFELTTRWNVPDLMFMEQCHVTVYPCEIDVQVLDLEIKLHAPTVTLAFEDNTGLGYNAAEMEYRKAVDANGRIGESEVSGQFSAWGTLSGIAANEPIGVGILPHPDNGQTRFEAQDASLGFLKACPEPFRLEVGDTRALRYRVLIYVGDLFTVDVANYYDAYCDRALH